MFFVLFLVFSVASLIICPLIGNGDDLRILCIYIVSDVNRFLESSILVDIVQMCGGQVQIFLLLSVFRLELFDL